MKKKKIHMGNVPNSTNVCKNENEDHLTYRDIQESRPLIYSTSSHTYIARRQEMTQDVARPLTLYSNCITAA